MRLAQIARKVQVKPTEIRSFIKDKFNVELDADPNIKLEDDQVNAILEAFKVEEEVVKPVKEKAAKTAPKEEVVEEKEVEPEAIEEPIAEEVAEEKSVPKEEEIVADSAPRKKIVEIKYDETEDVEAKTEEEPTSFQAVEVNPDAELIAAKVQKLEGLKVVGKIDLGDEPKEEELPTADAIESEIDGLDGDVDTSEFPDLTETYTDEEKEAIFAELDAQMDQRLSTGGEVKTVTNEAKEVLENIDEEEEYSIYKNARGEYRFTPEQKKNRQISLAAKAKKNRIEAQKKKKKRHYEENVASKVKPQPKKTKIKPSTKKVKAQQKEEPKGLWKRFISWLND